MSANHSQWVSHTRDIARQQTTKIICIAKQCMSLKTALISWPCRIQYQPGFGNSPDSVRRAAAHQNNARRRTSLSRLEEMYAERDVSGRRLLVGFTAAAWLPVEARASRSLTPPPYRRLYLNVNQQCGAARRAPLSPHSIIGGDSGEMRQLAPPSSVASHSCMLRCLTGEQGWRRDAGSCRPPAGESMMYEYAASY